MLAAVGILTVAAALTGLLVTGGERRAPTVNRLPGLAGTPRSTLALIDSVGVVVHFNYADTAYGRQAQAIAMLGRLGVHHIRDAVAAPGSQLAAGLQAAAGQGITATLATSDVAVPPSQSVADSLRVLRGSIDAFEGPNEIDNSGISKWPQIVEAYMPALAAAVHQQAPGVAVIGPSLLYPSNRRLVSGLPGLFNEHPYPLGGPPEPALGRAISELPPNARRTGVVFTETGYHNALHSSVGPPPVSEQAAGIYLPRLLLANFAAGIRATFIYELLDEKPDFNLADPEQHFGLLRNDLSPKPAFLAIQTLIAALRDSPGSGHAPWPRVQSRVGNPTWQLRLVRPDASQVLALWRPVSVWDQSTRKTLTPTVQPVDLSFARGARDIVIWRPSLTAAPLARHRELHRLRLELGGDVVLVSFR